MLSPSPGKFPIFRNAIVTDLTSYRYVGVTTSLVCLIASLGAWPASYVITAEVSALRLRAKTQGIAWAAGGVANLVFSAVTPFIYNADMGNLRSKIGFVWTPLCAMAFAGAWYMVPEMLGRSPLEVDLMFEQKLRTRKFRHWSKDDDLTLTTSVSGRHQSHGSPASSNC